MMARSFSRSPDVIVVGNGIIGLSVAFAAANSGFRASVVGDSRPGTASPAAAGMLAPTLEHASETQDNAASAFALASRDRYPEWLAQLAERTAVTVPLDRNGILEVALTAAQLQELSARAPQTGAEMLGAADLAAIEPEISQCTGGLLHPHDGSVDNVILLDALRIAVQRSGVETVPGAAAGVRLDSRGCSVQMTDGSSLAAGNIVLACGAWVSELTGIPRSLPVEPVRGQMIAFGVRPVRRVVYGPDGYLVPRSDGRTLAGATMERVGFSPITTPDGVTRLRGIAAGLCPSLSMPPATSWAGLRPVTPDLLPILGADPDDPRLIYACGHSRNGVLMAPLTGDAVAALLAGEPTPYDITPFAAARFKLSG